VNCGNGGGLCHMFVFCYTKIMIPILLAKFIFCIPTFQNVVHKTPLSSIYTFL
jgi:hypothetical protein